MRPAARFLPVLVFYSTLLFGQLFCYGREETYKLGGMREPVVTVKEARTGLNVTTGFLAVDAFDEATNQKLNRQKGRGFAFVALARFMGIDKSNNVMVAGLTPTRIRLCDRAIEMSFTIEKGKIQKVNRPAMAASDSPKLMRHKQDIVDRTSTDTDAPASMARAADYLDTLTLIDAEGRSSAADLLEGRADVCEAIANIEDKTLGVFESIRRQMTSDALLRQEDRNRIFVEIARVRKDFLTALRIELQILEASTK